MAKSDSPNKSKHSTQVLTAADARDQPDPGEWRTLYVLGFGIAGAILANGLLFAYLASLYASG